MSAIRSINIKTLSDVFDSIGSLELVKLLQGLPLAINQAGSYMRETGTTVSKYIDSYNHKWKKLMKDQNYFTLRESADRSVLTTWTVSFDHLREQNEDAANFLKLWAFLDNQDLWYELLTPSLHHEIFDEVPGWFVRCASDELDFKKCMGLLSKYSFINTKFESSSFFMHSVLHHWCLHAFEKENAIMSWLAVVVVVSAVPSQTMPDYSLLQRRLLPHCDRVFSLLEQSIQETFNYKVDIPSVSAACHRLGDLYSDQGKMKEAEDMYLRALTGKEKAWGPAHTSTLNTVNNLGNLYKNQGKMKEAGHMYLRALTGFEQAWGSGHKTPIDVRCNLAFLYKKMAMFKDAAKHFELVVQGYTKILGSDHWKTVDASNQLKSCEVLNEHP